MNIPDLSATILAIAAGRELAQVPETSTALNQLLYRHGLAAEVAVSYPELADNELKATAARLWARETVMDAHAAELGRDLKAAGIRHALLKGPFLSKFVYANPRARTYTDIDLLVPREDLEGAIDTISRYEAVTGIPAKQPRGDKRDIPLRDVSGIEFTIDLHWDLFSYSQMRGAGHAATAEAWERASSPAVDGGPWHLPTDAHFAFLATHATLDHRFRLILFRDLLELLPAISDWGSISDFAQRHELASFTHLALKIAELHLGLKVDDPHRWDLQRSYPAMRFAESLVANTDLVHFDGHTRHPLNLMVNLLHDSAPERRRLLIRAPKAYKGWWQRVRPSLESKQRASVAVVVSTRQRRGAEVFGSRLVDGMRERGRDSVLFSLSGATVEPATIRAETLSEELQRIPIRAAAALRRRIRAREIGVVVANGGDPLRAAVLSMLGMRSPPRLVYISIGEPIFWADRWFKRHLYRLFMARADSVIAVSAITAEQLRSEFGVPARKIRSIHPGVPEEFFTPVDRASHAELRLLYMGSLSVEKDPVMALDVLDRVLEEIDDVTLRFVGDGPLMSKLVSEVRLRGLEKRVELLGSVTDVLPHLRWADVMILTSRTEGLPGVLTEAAAAGLPSVSFDVGGVREAVEHGRSGLLVESRTAEAMAEAVLDLIGDGLERFGSQARELALERFTVDRAVSEYLAVFDGR